MSSKSRHDRDKYRDDYLRTLGLNMITAANSTETSLSYMLKAECDKVNELLKRNASTKDLLESGKTFCSILSNIVLIQLIPLLKDNSNMPTSDKVKNEDTKNVPNAISPIVVDNLAGTSNTVKKDKNVKTFEDVENTSENSEIENSDSTSLQDDSPDGKDSIQNNNERPTIDVAMLLSDILSIFDTSNKTEAVEDINESEVIVEKTDITNIEANNKEEMGA